MKRTHFKKYLGRLAKPAVFLFVLIILLFSLYKVASSSTSVNAFDGCGECGRCPKARCNQSCFCVGCIEGLVCYNGRCRNPNCLEEKDCVCPTTTPTPTPTPTPSPSAPPEGGPGPQPGAPVCGATTPNAPTLLSVSKSGAKADLVWTKVEPVTHYSISYGVSSGNYIYGVNNTGNTTSFTVGDLDPAKDYCFAVRAVHDCAPSELSNEICTGAVLGQVLGVTTLAETGSLMDELFQILFIIGSVCLSLGLRMYLPVKKTA